MVNFCGKAGEAVRGPRYNPAVPVSQACGGFSFVFGSLQCRWQKADVIDSADSIADEFGSFPVRDGVNARDCFSLTYPNATVLYSGVPYGTKGANTSCGVSALFLESGLHDGTVFNLYTQFGDISICQQACYANSIFNATFPTDVEPCRAFTFHESNLTCRFYGGYVYHRESGSNSAGSYSGFSTIVENGTDSRCYVLPISENAKWFYTHDLGKVDYLKLSSAKCRGPSAGAHDLVDLPLVHGVLGMVPRFTGPQTGFSNPYRAMGGPNECKQICAAYSSYNLGLAVRANHTCTSFTWDARTSSCQFFQSEAASADQVTRFYPESSPLHVRASFAFHVYVSTHLPRARISYTYDVPCVMGHL